MANHSSKNLIHLKRDIIQALSGLPGHIYLTDGAAISHFYLNHRHNSQLHFLVENDEDIQIIHQMIVSALGHTHCIESEETLNNTAKLIIGNDMASITLFITKNNHPRLKSPVITNLISVDDLYNVFINILHQLSETTSAECLLDVIIIARAYQFSWQDITHDLSTTTNNIIKNIKAINHGQLIDIGELNISCNADELEQYIAQLFDDIAHARDNSLCPVGPELTNAIANPLMLALDNA
ncbi:hypothetical protein LX69_02907 [Breznakibacter xylanolyticus]|uniref:Uncharacterized protein n=1 Tax=Breznakibacter xylanolyticus TaxID=990 RepID=A0A2W7NGQ7_9BACT|nr:hypothetical protein LX69_02907 [Breznakibacter xylanolyticus]